MHRGRGRRLRAPLERAAVSPELPRAADSIEIDVLAAHAIGGPTREAPRAARRIGRGGPTLTPRRRRGSFGDVNRRRARDGGPDDPAARERARETLHREL